jgi:hypothetical protein
VDELVIRFGAIEVARCPTSDDVRKALEDVESWVHQREDFSIEKASNWRPELIDGQLVIHCVKEPPYATAATFYLERNPTPVGWFVTYHAEDCSQFALAAPLRAEAGYIEGICCGGPLTVRTDCLVPLKLALEALAYFVQQRDRSPSHSWVDWNIALRFPAR